MRCINVSIKDQGKFMTPVPQIKTSCSHTAIEANNTFIMITKKHNSSISNQYIWGGRSYRTRTGGSGLGGAKEPGLTTRVSGNLLTTAVLIEAVTATGH